MKIIKHDVISKNFDGRGNFWGTVARLPDGRIGAAWSGGRMGHVCPFGRLEMAYSTDGKKFTFPSIVFDSLLDDRDAGLTAWGDKTVLATFNTCVSMQKDNLNSGAYWTKDPALKGIAENHLNRISPEYEEKHLGSLLFISDDGETFNDFVKVPIFAPHGPIGLKNGKLFYVGHPFDKNIPWNGVPLEKDIYVMQTADGENWSEPMAIAKGEDCKNFALWEPNAVECENGDIILTARVHLDEKQSDLLGIAISRSTDGGKTFTPFTMTSFEGAPPHILKLKNGKLVLTYCRRILPRKICARISDDNGYTWGEEYTLVELNDYPDMGYPSSVELDDGSILTAYYARKNYVENVYDNSAKFACVTWKM